MPNKKKKRATDREREVPSKTDYLTDYYQIVTDLMHRILTEQREPIERAAAVMADKIEADGLIFVFGSGGHSNMGAEEMFHRAGGLACISPVFVDGIRIPHVPLGERVLNYAPYIFNFYEIGEGDVLILVNAYGVNPVTIDATLEARKRKVFLIGVTSTEYAERLPKDHRARHPSALNLHENVDVFINTYIPYGDAAVRVEGVASKVASLSTYSNAFVLNCLVLETARRLVARGIDPPIINSINTIGGEEKNAALYEKYRKRIRWL